MGGGGGGGMSDIFDLFGGGGRSRQQRGPQRGESVSHRLKVSLEDMYKGTTRYRLSYSPCGYLTCHSKDFRCTEVKLGRCCPFHHGSDESQFSMNSCHQPIAKTCGPIFDTAKDD